jgi:hypothetical protein
MSRNKITHDPDRAGRVKESLRIPQKAGGVIYDR